MEIIICKDFTDAPGPRFKSQGDFSGEAFREDFLIPKFKEALEQKEKLVINFDGTFGYPTSFLEEAFGGLKEKYDKELILKTLEFISNDEIGLISEVKGYIDSNERKTKK
ncbi:MAG: STAS-like domain-containing protein [Bacilli bacterium]|jgi:hypothetical protein|nr:STAS-like domain-containing protein [Bacilli bacterium]